MTITNSGESEIRITGVSSTASRSTELHEVKMEENLMTMRELPELVILPGQTVELKQGSMHLMLIGVNQSLQEGDEVEIQFELQDLPAISITVPVRKEI